jgi:hypothetical protein
MGLSTLDLESKGSGEGRKLPKKIQPGNHRVKLHKLELEQYTYIENAYYLLLHLETEALEGFEGFYIDNDQEKGRYDGQIGKVKGSFYAFADGFTKRGTPIQRDKAILIFLQNLCKSLGISDWFKEQNDKHKTIEEFIDAFNGTAPIKNKFFDCCIGGKEWTNKEGYIDYNLFFPNSADKQYAFGELDAANIMNFDDKTHIIKQKEAKKIDKFDSDDEIKTPRKSSSDFNLD